MKFRKSKQPWTVRAVHALVNWDGYSSLSPIDLERLIHLVAMKLEDECLMTWKAAQKEVSNCMKHYEGKWGDPSGCLMGLSAEFSARANSKNIPIKAKRTR